MSAAGGREQLRQRLIAGFSAQGMALVARTCQDILLVPLFITMWGAEVYNDWLILFAAAGFLALGDLGMQNYFGNLILITWSRGEKATTQHVINIALASYAVTCGGLLVLLVAGLWLFDWPTWLAVATVSDRDAYLTLVFLALALLILIPRGVMSAIYRARGEFGRSINQDTILNLITAGAMAGALALGAWLPVVGLAYLTISIVVGWGVVVVDQRRRYRDLRYGVTAPDRREVAEAFDKSRWYFLPHTSLILLQHAPVVIIGVLADAAIAVAAFTVSRTLTGMIRQLPVRVAEVAGVEMARHYAEQDAVGLQRLYALTGRLTGAISGMAGGFLLAVAGPVMLVWTRGQIAYDPWLIGILTLPLLLVVPGHSGFVTLLYTNQPGPIALARVVQTGLGLALCVALVSVFGNVGAAAGLAIGETIAVGVYLTAVATRRFEVPLVPYLTATMGAMVVALGLSYGSALALVHWLQPGSLVGLALVGVAWAILMAGPALLLMSTPGQRGVLVRRIAAWWRRDPER